MDASAWEWHVSQAGADCFKRDYESIEMFVEARELPDTTIFWWWCFSANQLDLVDAGVDQWRGEREDKVFGVGL